MAKSKRPEINDNNLAIAYYRYSSHSQNEMSIDQQKQQAHAYAEAHGLTIVREYEDAAKTGTNANRPGYQAMLSEVGKTYYAENYGDGVYLAGLQGQLADVDKQLANVVKAVTSCGAHHERDAYAAETIRLEGLRLYREHIAAPAAAEPQGMRG